MKPLILVGTLLLAVPGLASSAETSNAPGDGLATIELTCVDPAATGYGTFQSYNQKVVANRRGIFMTHIRSRNEAYTAQQWRLSWSRDNGQTFETLYEATHATNPPVLETDDDDNVYLIRPDFVDGNAYLYRFLAAADYRQPSITPIPNGSAGKFSMTLDRAAARSIISRTAARFIGLPSTAPFFHRSIC